MGLSGYDTNVQAGAPAAGVLQALAQARSVPVTGAAAAALDMRYTQQHGLGEMPLLDSDAWSHPATCRQLLSFSVLWGPMLTAILLLRTPGWRLRCRERVSNPALWLLGRHCQGLITSQRCGLFGS